MRSPWISLEMDGCVASAAPQTLLHSTLLKHSLRAVAATALHGCPTRDAAEVCCAPTVVVPTKLCEGSRVSRETRTR